MNVDRFRLSSPPRLVVRTTTATFATVAAVLAVVFVVLLLDVRERVRKSGAERLEAGQRLFSTFELRRQRELQEQIALLAESPTLKAALDTYATESRGGGGASAAQIDRATQLRQTVQNELDRLGDRFQNDVIAIADSSQRTIAATGRLGAAWAPGSRLPFDESREPDRGDRVVTLPSGVFRALSVPLAYSDAPIGTLYVATALNDAYAAELSGLSGANTAIVIDGRVVGSTLTPAQASDAARAIAGRPDTEGIVTLSSEAHVFRRLFRAGPADFYLFGSIERASGDALQAAIVRLGWMAVGAMLLAGVASVALARTLSRPLDRLTREIVALREAGSVAHALAATGSSRELDELALTFNDLLQSLGTAQEETRAASVGAIRALAAALDARDPYTSGHSERVSALAVAIGREMAVREEDLAVLRLGALLHDIGKIGISDDVLRKPGKLTQDEYEMIKQHPGVGARILRPVPFLAPHIPIVELHHECPDGSGYPFGLRGDEIPLFARIVHVADAFDAITSARAYRPARHSLEATGELWRVAGSQFDAEVVAALVRALPSMVTNDAAPDGAWFRGAAAAGQAGVVTFPRFGDVREPIEMAGSQR